jgi:hypothetical protein
MFANPVDQIETIEVILNRKQTPIAFNNKLKELMDQGAFDTEEDAIAWIESTPIILELLYQPHHGLFAVESEAIECGVYSPYTTEYIDVKD